MYISLALVDDLKKEFQSFIEKECEGDEYATASISINNEDRTPTYHANGDPERDGYYSGMPPVGLQGSLLQFLKAMGLTYVSISLCFGEIDIQIIE